VLDVEVDASELAGVVKRLTGSAEAGDWSLTRLHEPIVSATQGIWRLQGQGWSVVLKLIGPGGGGHSLWQAGDQPEHWCYWRREVLAYESGLVSSLAGGLRAPECYLVAEQGDGSVALWLEDVSAPAATTWPPAAYSAAARRLGRAQGQFIVSRALPEHRWLSRDWLRSYLAQRDGDLPLLKDATAWELPLVRRWLPATLAEPLLQMRRDRALLLAALDRLPRTLSHFDFHPLNIFGGEDTTIVIDWSFVGIGAMAEDAGNLVPDSVFDFHVRSGEIDRLYDAVRNGYLSGLRDAGWEGPEEAVDLGMCATAAAKYSWNGPAMLRAALENRPLLNRRPLEEAFERWAPVIPWLLKCAERARHLADGIRS
jgi:hypothetical protein